MIENRIKNHGIARDRRQVTMTEVHDADVRRHVIGMTTIDVADDREVAIDSRVDE